MIERVFFWAFLGACLAIAILALAYVGTLYRNSIQRSCRASPQPPDQARQDD